MIFALENLFSKKNFSQFKYLGSENMCQLERIIIVTGICYSVKNWELLAIGGTGQVHLTPRESTAAVTRRRPCRKESSNKQQHHDEDAKLGERVCRPGV